MTDVLPTTLIEAMAAGVPAVGREVDGPEIIAPGQTYLLVPLRNPAALADAVLMLLEAPLMAWRFWAEARRVAFTRFDAGRAVRRLHDEYFDLAGRR